MSSNDGILGGLGDIDSGGPVETTQGNYGSANMLKAVASKPPSIAERLDYEIGVTERRLAAMKAAKEVIENAPALEVLQLGLQAMNRHNY